MKSHTYNARKIDKRGINYCLCHRKYSAIMAYTEVFIFQNIEICTICCFDTVSKSIEPQSKSNILIECYAVMYYIIILNSKTC